MSDNKAAKSYAPVRCSNRNKTRGYRMAETISKKFNLPKRTAYLEMPRAFYGKSRAGETSPFEGLNSRARILLAVIHTVNKIAGEPAKLTYEDFVAVRGWSKETVSKYKKLLIDKGIIEEVKRSRYKIKAEYNPKPFDKIKKCLFNEVVEMHEPELDDEGKSRKRRYKSYRKLSDKAILLLTFVEGMQGQGEFTSSQARLSVILDMPRATAGDAVRESVYARTLTCGTPSDVRKAKAGLTKYEVDEELRAVKYIEPKPTAGNKPDEAVKGYLENPQNRENPPRERVPSTKKDDATSRMLRAQIEQHYYDLRHQAEDRAEEVRERALRDKVYCDIEKQLNDVGIKIAWAEIRNPEEARELEAQRAALEVKGAQRLKQLGISKADFAPRYKCNICNDTGYDKAGVPCECLKWFIKTNR